MPSLFSYTDSYGNTQGGVTPFRGIGSGVAGLDNWRASERSALDEDWLKNQQKWLRLTPTTATATNPVNPVVNPGAIQTNNFLPGNSSVVSGRVGAGVDNSIEGLTRMVNDINQRAQQGANASRIPGGADLESQSSANIGGALRGELAPSVIRNIAQGAAERGVASGNPLGANSNADYLRSLGLTTLDLQNRGQDWLSGALARNPAAPIYSAGNQVLTAEQLQQAILAREEMMNRLAIARLRPGSGGGGSSATNWQGSAATPAPKPQPWKPPFPDPTPLPTPTPWTPTPNPDFSTGFAQSGGTWHPTYGDNPVLPFETNWNDILFGGNPSDLGIGSGDQGWSDLEDWFYGGGG